MELLPVLKGAATYIPWLYRAERGHTGGTIAARYCYGVWLRHLSLLEACGLPTQYDTVAELGPGDSLGISIAALLTGTKRIDALDVVRYARDQASQSVLTELVDLLTRREQIPDATELPAVHPRLSDYRFPRFLNRQRLAQSLSVEWVEKIRTAVSTDSENSVIRYHVPWHERWSATGANVDLVFSQAVLEHVEDLHGVHERLAAGLAIGGVTSHVIDFRSHRLTSGWDGHLQYGSRIWKVVKGRRPYLLNRCAPAEHLRVMRGAGFEIVRALRVTSSPTVHRQQLAAQFRDWSDEDLSTSTMVVIARRVR